MLRSRIAEGRAKEAVTKQSNGHVHPREGALTLLRATGIPPPSDIPGI